MSTKATFTPEEWQILRDAPHVVGMSVAMAGASGLFGTISEMFAAGKIIADTTSTSDSELLRAILNRDELKASQDYLRAAAKSQETSKLPEWVLAEAVAHCRQAVDILNGKGAPGERETYVKFLTAMANHVAQASTEGGFLGFGGERVSAKEREALATINAALGEGNAGAAA